MTKFTCETCKKTFEAEGTKQEWIDRTYGPCSRWVAVCPDCGAECQMARTAHPQEGGFDDAGMDGSSCGGGSCSCGN
jgi:hypothetical protein